MTHQELKYQVLRYYELNKPEALRFSSELDILSRATTFCQVVFPYNATLLIEQLDFEYKRDETSGLIQVSCKGLLPIYFPSDYSENEALSSYLLLMCEQSMESAHRYIKCPRNKSVFDVGCSEGIFSRMYCDHSNHIYGFDSKLWIDAYLKTTQGNNSFFIDELVTKNYKFENKLLQPLGCIKIDTEGSELEVLQAFEELILEHHPVIQVAVYHYEREYIDVVNWLIDRGYKVFSQAVRNARMLYPNDNIQSAPYFRFGVLIATQ